MNSVVGERYGIGYEASSQKYRSRIDSAMKSLAKGSISLGIDFYSQGRRRDFAMKSIAKGRVRL